MRQGERGVAPGARASKSSHTSAAPQPAEPPPELELPPELVELPPELLELPPELLEVAPELVELPLELPELPPELLELDPELELELPPELERPPELVDAPELELLPELRPSLDPSPETLGAHATAPVAIAIARTSTRRAGRRRGRSSIAFASGRPGRPRQEVERPVALLRDARCASGQPQVAGDLPPRRAEAECAGGAGGCEAHAPSDRVEAPARAALRIARSPEPRGGARSQFLPRMSRAARPTCAHPGVPERGTAAPDPPRRGTRGRAPACDSSPQQTVR